MKKIYIIQMHTGTFWSRIVRRYTGYKYSHIGLSFDENCETIYSIGRKKYNNPVVGGFVVQSSHDEFYRVFDKVYCRIFEVSVSDKQYSLLKRSLSLFEKEPDKIKYDIGGTFLREITHRPCTRKNFYVCTYFVAEILQKAKIHNFRCEPSMVKPVDFENLPFSKEIYNGHYPVMA